MRALEISMFIFILSFSLSAVGELFGYPATSVQSPVTLGEIEELQPNQSLTVEEASVLPFISVFSWINKILKILIGAATLGSTVNSLVEAAVGVGLPEVMVIGLNAVSVVCIFLAVFQLVFGRIVKMMQ